MCCPVANTYITWWFSVALSHWKLTPNTDNQRARVSELALPRALLVSVCSPYAIGDLSRYTRIV